MLNLVWTNCVSVLLIVFVTFTESNKKRLVASSAQTKYCVFQ